MDSEISSRATEILKIFRQLRDLQLGNSYEEINKFREISNNFIRDGKDSKGKISIAGTKRIICYEFSSQKVECFLKFDECV
tara:strand:+ start:1462 stop:1704 length:243 start_codon:yes stop_codon:yes gene_type:complete